VARLAGGLPQPGSRPGRAFAEENAELVSFHCWLQWTAERQLEEAQRRARQAGMRIGLYLDLAVGVAPDGSATWSDSDLTVPGARSAHRRLFQLVRPGLGPGAALLPPRSGRGLSSRSAKRWTAWCCTIRRAQDRPRHEPFTAWSGSPKGDRCRGRLRPVSFRPDASHAREVSQARRSIGSARISGSCRPASVTY
jgi:hypothetical protein